MREVLPSRRYYSPYINAGLAVAFVCPGRPGYTVVQIPTAGLVWSRTAREKGKMRRANSHSVRRLPARA